MSNGIDLKDALRQMLAVMEQERQALAALDLTAIMGCVENKTALCGSLSGISNDNDVKPDGSLGKLEAQLTCDLQYGYTIADWIGQELSLRIGIYNVFDTLPPATQDNNGFDATLYDPRGRMAYLKLLASY